MCMVCNVFCMGVWTLLVQMGYGNLVVLVLPYRYQYVLEDRVYQYASS